VKIGIMTDSSAYLTPEQVKEHHIKVLPLPILWGDQTYYDLQTIGFEEFYEKLATAKVLPTTSQPSTGEVQKAIDEFVEEGYTDVFIFTLSSGISGYYNSVCSYAKQEKRLTIHPVDSKITCAGLAFQVLLAARLVEAGANVDEIIAKTDDLRSTTRVRFMVDDLGHLKRTGRLSNAASFIGGMLKIKPILDMHIQGDGKIVAIAKERQNKRALRHIVNDVAADVASHDYPIQATIFHADDPQKEQEWCQAFQTALPQVRYSQSIVGPAIGVHVGQHCMAIIWSRDINSYFD
jgi:DegV family protein with EDD domain